MVVDDNRVPSMLISKTPLQRREPRIESAEEELVPLGSSFG